MKIKSLLLVLFALVVVVAGCDQKSEPTSKAPSTLPTNAVAPEAAPVPAPAELVIKDIKVGTGPAVVPGKQVVVHYKGWLDDGSVFDTSKKPGREPFEFTVGGGQVIQGWDKGLVGMKVGGVRELTIPASLGYGSQNVGPIPANSTLHFEIELLKIK